MLANGAAGRVHRHGHVPTVLASDAPPIPTRIIFGAPVRLRF
jgi:hypothetical protein